MPCSNHRDRLDAFFSVRDIQRIPGSRSFVVSFYHIVTVAPKARDCSDSLREPGFKQYTKLEFDPVFMLAYHTR